MSGLEEYSVCKFKGPKKDRRSHLEMETALNTWSMASQISTSFSKGGDTCIRFEST